MYCNRALTCDCYIFYAALITNEYNFNDKIKYLNIWDLDYWKVLLVTIFTLFNPRLIKKIVLTLLFSATWLSVSACYLFLLAVVCWYFLATLH